VTLNGANVPPLGTGERAIKDVKVGAVAIAARLSGATTTAAGTAGAAVGETPSPSAEASTGSATGSAGNASGTP